MRRRDELAAHNERVKLTATTINAIGLAFIALGIVRPFVDPETPVAVGVVGLVCHAVAHYILKQMETDK
jgi:hypothetical protein